ncbi:MAG: hypothetical protein LW629_10740 [Burkholderiales bacterium]|jgi:hypothetical protein|nr:hypothetical protein [Burkholderiales bacterium]
MDTKTYLTADIAKAPELLGRQFLDVGDLMRQNARLKWELAQQKAQMQDLRQMVHEFLSDFESTKDFSKEL